MAKISKPQEQVRDLLEDNGPMPLADIKEVVGKPSGAVVNILKALSSKGLVVRKGDDYMLTPTDEPAKPTPPRRELATGKPMPPPSSGKPPIEEAWNPLDVADTALVLVFRNGKGHVEVVGSESGKQSELKRLPNQPLQPFDYGNEADPEAMERLAISILSWLFPPELMGAGPIEAFIETFIRSANSTQWGLSAKQAAAWMRKQSNHSWVIRTIKKGTDAGRAMPARCSKCGAVQRPDGKSGPCITPA